MRPVILVTTDSVAFTKQAARDCLAKGDAPLNLQLMNTVGLTDDEVSAVGEVVKTWQASAEAVVVYDDLGVTKEMQDEIDVLALAGKAAEQRKVPDPDVKGR